jgi:hypothetical protein
MLRAANKIPFAQILSCEDPRLVLMRCKILYREIITLFKKTGLPLFLLPKNARNFKNERALTNVLADHFSQLASPPPSGYLHTNGWRRHSGFP